MRLEPHEWLMVLDSLLVTAVTNWQAMGSTDGTAAEEFAAYAEKLEELAKKIMADPGVSALVNDYADAVSRE